MKKFAVAMFLVLLWALPASAAIEYTLLKSDTLALYAADSSSVIYFSGAKKAWIDLVATKLSYSDIGALARDTTLVAGLADGAKTGQTSYAYAHRDSVAQAYADSIYTLDGATSLIFAVQAREVLPGWTTTNASYENRNLGPSTYADSVYVPWNPTRSTGTAATDSLSYNRVLPGNAAPGSSEIQAVILPNVGVWSSQRSVRIPLDGFVAEYASFRWRLLAGSNGFVKVRAVLGIEK